MAVTPSASESKTCCLSCLSLSYVVLFSLTLRVCRSNISLMCDVYGITVNIPVSISVLISWSISIPILLIDFSHVVYISLAELFSPYVNITFTEALDSSYFDFNLLVLACCTLYIYLLMHLTLSMPIQKCTSISLYIVVDLYVSIESWYLLYLVYGNRYL